MSPFVDVGVHDPAGGLRSAELARSEALHPLGSNPRYTGWTSSAGRGTGMKLAGKVGLAAGGAATVAIGGFGGAALVQTRTALPVDPAGTIRSGLSAAVGGAAAGVLALGGWAAHRTMPPGAARTILTAAGAFGSALAGSAAIGIALGPRLGIVGHVLGTGFYGTPDWNGSRNSAPPGMRHANNEYRPVPGDRLPDGVPQAPERVLYQPGILGGPKLRFSTTIANMGEGPMQLGIVHLGKNGATQIIENDLTGTPTTADIRADFFYHAEHRHIHFDDWASTSLYVYKRNSDGTLGAPLTSGKKLSFNVTDSDHVAPELDPDGENRYRTTWNTYNNQGISVGWADTYGPMLAGQFIDVPKLDPGQYVLRQIFDPDDRIAESDERNNVRDTVIDVGGGPLRTIEVLSSGPPVSR